MSSAREAWVAGWPGSAAGKAGQHDNAFSSSSSSVDPAEVLPADVESAEASPDEVERHCTDIRWIIAFLLANAVLGCVLYVADRSGAASRVIALHDFQHNHCGKGEKVNEPYIFFCKNASGELELDFPICSADCPTGPQTQHRCWNEAAGVWNLTEDYPTRAVSGVACGSLNMTLGAQQMGWVARNTGWLGKVVFVLQSWQPLLIALLVAAVASNLYIGLLGEFAKQLVYVGLLVLSAVPLVWGLVLLRWWYNGTYAPGLAYGALLVGSGASVSCIFCCAGHDIDKISSLIKLSCKCVMRLPPMRTGPAVTIVVKYSYFALVFRGILQLYSALESCSRGDLLVPRGAVYTAMIFCSFMLLWTNNLLDAFSDFCLAYLTEVWYFHGGVHGEWRPLCMEAYKVAWIALRYHTGTLVLGALVVGFVRPLRLVFGAISALGKSGAQSPLGCLLSSCCCCLADLYQNHLELLSKNAYMEVALSGSDLRSAARSALQVTRTDSGLYSVLNGATWFFQLAGVGLIMLLGNIVAYFVVSSCRARAWWGRPGCSAIWWGDEEVGLYVSLCTWGSGLTALPFMLVFDMVSDAILYSHLVAKWRMAQRPETNSVLTDAASYIWGILGMGCLGGRHTSQEEVDVLPSNTAHRTRGTALEADLGTPCDAAYESAAALFGTPGGAPHESAAALLGAHGTAAHEPAAALLRREAPLLCTLPRMMHVPPRPVLAPGPQLVVQRVLLPPPKPMPTARAQIAQRRPPSSFVIPVLQPVQQTVHYTQSMSAPGSLSLLPSSLQHVQQSTEHRRLLGR